MDAMKRSFFYSAAALITASLAACGGGGGGSGGNNGASGLTITGVAATGAAIAGGSVEAICATGSATATTNVDGTYSVTVSNGVQPCILRATDPISKLQLHSIVESGSKTANITPITDLVVANTLGDTPTNGFSNFSSAAQAKITSSNIATAVTRIQAVTAALGSEADLTGVDVMKGSLVAASAVASGDATDKKIDALMAALNAADKKIAELSAQVKTLINTGNAAALTFGVVGDAVYGLANCPYARNGDLWILDLIGSAPEAWNANFNTMVLKKISNNTSYAINLKRDSNNNPIPCAFTSAINGQTVEYRVSTGGVGVWVNSTDFGVFLPAQKTKVLSDSSFAGTYPSVAFVKAKNSSFRLGIPMSFEIKADGSVSAFSCDVSKNLPDCSPSVSSSTDPVTCTPVSNGTLACSSPGGLAATAVLYLTGNQATLFMAVTNMNVSGSSYGGLIALTKAPELKLPAVGKTTAAGSSWYAGVQSGSNTVTAADSIASKIEAVDATANTVLTSYTGSTVTSTTYINVPSKGFLYGVSNGYKSIATGSLSGWALEISKSPNASYYDGWSAIVKMK